jgi:hypothetical protein
MSMYASRETVTSEQEVRKPDVPIRQCIIERVPPLFLAQAYHYNDDILICGRASRIALKTNVGAGGTPHRPCAHRMQSLVVDI